jgi:hypothetical protein
MKMNTFWVHESNSGVEPQGDTTEIALDIEMQPKKNTWFSKPTGPTMVRSISLS